MRGLTALEAEVLALAASPPTIGVVEHPGALFVFILAIAVWVAVVAIPTEKD